MSSFKAFTKEYIQSLHTLLNEVDLDTFELFYTHLEKSEHKIYVIGNGGSSATASHMVNDLAIGLKRRGKKPFDAISLNDNSAVSFAIANDIGFENVFYMQLKDILTPQDTVVAISCSGNSPNIVKAVEYAKEVGSTVVGLTGFDGGTLKELSDIKLHVQTKKGEYGLVEDIHMIFNHILYSYFLRDEDA